jgi:hypothetical protein
MLRANLPAKLRLLVRGYCARAFGQRIPFGPDPFTLLHTVWFALIFVDN